MYQRFDDHGAHSPGFEGETVTLIPAFGRDYSTEAEVKFAWESGKEFQLSDSVYLNRWDISAFPGMVVIIRYNGSRDLLEIRDGRYIRRTDPSSIER